MKYVSLFSGCGGIDLALDRAGMSCVLQAEINAQATSVLRRHWPEKKRVRDVRLVRRSRSLRGIGLVAGGFPCTDLSVAGKRAGLAGKRSGLWFEFERVIGELLPEHVLIENVPGLLSSNGGRDFAVILSGLAELGYGWAYRILDAQFDGVPQRRRRVFIVGCLGGRADRAAQILFESDRLPWRPAPSRETGTRVAASLTAGVASGRGVNRPGRRREDNVNLVQTSLGSHHSRNAPDDTLAIVCRPLKAGGNLRHDESHDTYVTCTIPASNGGVSSGLHPVVVAFDERNVTSGENRSNPQPGDPFHTLHSSPPSIVGYISPRALRNSDSANEVGIKDGEIHDTLQSDGPGAVAFNYQTGGSKAMLGIHREMVTALGTTQTPALSNKYGVRRLMPIECERCQGMPDDWTRYGLTEDGKEIELSDSARYRLIGNSVAIPTVEWIAKRIAADAA